MKIQKKQINITLDASVLKEVRKLAVEADRSLSGYINYVLKMHAEEARRRTMRGSVSKKVWKNPNLFSFCSKSEHNENFLLYNRHIHFFSMRGYLYVNFQNSRNTANNK